MNSSLIFSLREACVRYEKKVIFKDLDVNIHKNDLIALVGKNGVGKTTLLRIISEDHDLDLGEIWKQGGLRVNYFSQQLSLDEWNSVEAELLRVLENEEEKFKIDIFCNNLSLNKFSIIKNLSGGQKIRVGLIKTLIMDSDILLLDEPTNHLDLECIIWLENFLKSYQGAILCVSHDRTFLSNISNKVFWLDRGNIRISPTGFKDFDQWSEDLLKQEGRELKNRKQFVSIELEWANRGVKARVKRNLKRMERANKLKAELEKDEASYRKVLNTMKPQLLKPSLDSSKFIAEFYKVSLAYKKTNKYVLEDISIKISKNDRIGLLGNNGTGKSTFLRALIGDVPISLGTIKIKKNMNFSYFDQMRSTLDHDQTIKKILVPSGGDYLKVQGKDRHVCSYLKDFMFDPSKATDSIHTLSGGQKNRLLLAKVLANPKTGLILDEPTNDLDLEMMDLLTEMLTNYKGTLLIVSHDRDFLDQTVNKILHFEGNGKISIFMGGYSDFLNYHKGKAINNTVSKKQNISNHQKSIKKMNKLSFKYKYELEQIPKEIENIQIRINEISKELTNSNLYKDNFDRFDLITKEAVKLKDNLQEKEDRWLELLVIQESINLT